MALAGLLAEELRGESLDPLAAKPPQFPAKADRVIFLFMHGGPSQVDTFDYKPLLERDHGKPLPFDKPRVVSARDGQSAEVAVEVSPARRIGDVGQRTVSASGAAASMICA